jgi:hypothetical protein
MHNIAMTIICINENLFPGYSCCHAYRSLSAYPFAPFPSCISLISDCKRAFSFITASNFFCNSVIFFYMLSDYCKFGCEADITTDWLMSSLYYIINIFSYSGAFSNSCFLGGSTIDDLLWICSLLTYIKHITYFTTGYGEGAGAYYYPVETLSLKFIDSFLSNVSQNFGRLKFSDYVNVVWATYTRNLFSSILFF